MPADTPESLHNDEAEYELPVDGVPRNLQEQIARNAYEASKASGDPLPPVGGPYDSSRMGRR